MYAQYGVYKVIQKSLHSNPGEKSIKGILSNLKRNKKYVIFTLGRYGLRHDTSPYQIHGIQIIFLLF